MQIGISRLFARPTPAGGAESMLNNLIFGLTSVMGTNDCISVFDSFERQERNPRVIHRRIPGKNRFVQETFMLPLFGGRLDSILFSNYFTPPYMRGARTVTLIHDLQQLHYPEFFSLKKRAWMRATQEFTMRRANAVVTLSEFWQARHLIRLWESVRRQGLRYPQSNQLESIRHTKGKSPSAASTLFAFSDCTISA